MPEKTSEGAIIGKSSSRGRLRVLISAHEFSPDRGSECAVGWNIATRLASYHDVTVLCADGPALFPDSYREEVCGYFKRHGEIPGLRVVFVEQPPVAIRYAHINRRLMALTRGIGWQPLYYQGLDGWHMAAFQRAEELGLDNFDVVHQLTPISFMRQGYMWATGLPFFWGPVGGMCKVPPAFSRTGGMTSVLFEAFRSCSIEWRTRFSRQFESAVRKACRIWAITEDEARIMDATEKGKTSLMIETASPSGTNGYERRYDGIRRLRICWSGMHEARKALPLLLNALHQLPGRERVELDILGEGPETPRWQLLAKKLSLPNITWHGLLPYHEARQTMGQADLFIHSSFREGTPHVVLESLGWGVPVICHDACGMAVAVDDTCGIKIPFVDPERSIRGFRDSLERFLLHPELVEQLSRGALRRAAEMSWDAKVREIAEAYTQA